jgi:hypothetical protein
MPIPVIFLHGLPLAHPPYVPQRHASCRTLWFCVKRVRHEAARTEVGVRAKEQQMKTGKRLFHWQIDEIRGQPVQTWGYECIPIGQVLQLKWPGGRIVWHRPLAVEVRQGGHSTRLPIPDVTRRLQISLAAAAALLWGMPWMIRRVRRAR